MSPRLNPVRPTATVASDPVAVQTIAMGQSAVPPVARQPTGRALPPAAGTAQRNSQTVLGHFGLPASPATSALAPAASMQSQQARDKQLNAAVESWVQTQEGCNKMLIRKKMKAMLWKSGATPDFSGMGLTSFFDEVAQAKYTPSLDLRDNELTSFPAEAGQIKGLRHLQLDNNQLTAFPAEMRVAESLEILELTNNLLTAFPAEMHEAKALKELYIDHNALSEQRAQLSAIQARLKNALDSHAKNYVLDPNVLKQARSTMRLMFQESQGGKKDYYNEFQYSAGHVLAYMFLALEAQWERTPAIHQEEARENSMAALIDALESGSGMCDTRLCEEVMQTIGIPLTKHAQAHPEIVEIQAPSTSADESRQFILEEAKAVLGELLNNDPALTGDAQPDAWRPMLIQKMQEEHPRLPMELVEKQMQEIESMWETFQEMVLEQRSEAIL